MNLRQKEPVNYKELHNGEPLVNECMKKPTWSTSKLWAVEIIGERDTANGKEVEVHYPGWSSSYNEWRQLEEIVTRSADCQESEAIGHLRHDLKVKVKENLHVQRGHDSEVTITIPVQYETFQEFLSTAKPVGTEKKGGRTFYRCSLNNIIICEWQRLVV